MMAETYDALKGCPPGTFPPQVLIELSSLPRSDKDRIIAMLQPKPQPPNPLAMEAQRLHLEGLAGKNAKQAADTHKTLAGAEQARATAEEKRARAGQMAHGVHLDAAEFARDTLLEAAKVHHDLNAPQPQPGGPQAPPQPGRLYT